MLITDLPRDIVSTIVEHLDVESKARLKMTCKYFESTVAPVKMVFRGMDTNSDFYNFLRTIFEDELIMDDTFVLCDDYFSRIELQIIDGDNAPYGYDKIHEIVEIFEPDHHTHHTRDNFWLNRRTKEPFILREAQAFPYFDDTTYEINHFGYSLFANIIHAIPADGTRIQNHVFPFGETSSSDVEIPSTCYRNRVMW